MAVTRVVALVAGSLATVAALPYCWWSGPLERPPDSSSTLSPGGYVTSTSNPVRSARFVGERCGE